ncbi:MFS transporter [Pseudoduganella eburnea]|uniref:MFS transporter n=1 Tax=Massilia eburnea TaxID=1776165 RepID=A0A6L6QJ70_9BURK|nr:MFS transporter [Massilia eburnea]MTW11686.1 MFS transporter [Massilia eburnea]
MAALRWLFAIQLLSMGAMEMSGPFWPLQLRALGDAPGGLAVASAVAYAGPLVTAMLFTPVWGRIGDRVGHKPMLLRALLALAATQLWLAFAGSATVVLAVRLLQGALAGFIAAAQAYGAGIVARAERGALMARLQVATALGSMLGPLAGGLAYSAFGFAAVNAIAAAICLACAACAARVLPAERREGNLDGLSSRAASPAASRASSGLAPQSVAVNNDALGEAAGLRGVVAGLLAGIVLVQAGKMMPQGFFSLYAEQVLHAAPWLTGLCYGATAAGLCLFAPFWAKQFRDKPRAWVLQRIEWICWACAGIVALQAIGRSIALVLAVRLAWGIAMAALLPVFYGLLSQETCDAQQGRVLGAGNSAAKAGALLGAAAGGLAMAWLPLEHIFWSVATLYMVAALGMRVWRGQAAAQPISA